MRKLFMAVAILGISATVSFAKAQCVNENGNKEPFAVEFGKLSSYLDLTPSQMDEVYDINEYFKGQQKESLSRAIAESCLWKSEIDEKCFER